MRLVSRLTLVLMLCAALVLTLQAIFHASRVMRLHESETRDDLQILATSLGGAVQELWQVAGEARARNYVKRADSRRASTRIQLVRGPGIGPEQRGLVITRSGDQLLATMPLRVRPASGPVVLELTRTMNDRKTFVDHVIWTQIVTTGAMVVIFATISMILGVRLVGRRVERLATQARQVARGDFSTTADTRNDELGFLAREMNQMAAQLGKAQRLIREERRGRTELLEQLRHSDRLSTIGRIASSIAHELGTPLNVVSGRATMIVEDEQTGDESRESAGIIVDQAHQMAQNIRQLLNYSRGPGVQLQRTDAAEIVDQALRLMEPLADDQGVSLERADGRPIEAELDSGKLLQVLTNLIHNGIQAMPDGGRLSIGLDTEDVDQPADIHSLAGRYLRIDVQDEGIGISAEDQERIFQPFFTTKAEGQGTGLGLSVCQGIVREHGGWLALQSEPGQGSCFKVYLPVGGEA